jgi:hypothetical protein
MEKRENNKTENEHVFSLTFHQESIVNGHIGLGLGEMPGRTGKAENGFSGAY